MARAYEHDSSADGDVVGLDRIDSSLTYVSEIDAPDDNPLEPVAVLLPIGHPHPRPEKSGLVVQRYVQRRTENPVIWFVDIIFDFPGRAGFAGWLMHTTYGEESVRRFNDLDGKIIGPWAYKPVPTTTPTEFYAQTLKGRVHLHRPEREVRRRIGMDVFAGTGTFVLTRTLLGLTASRLRAVHPMMHTANASRFNGWHPGELLFRRAILREEIAPGDPFSRKTGDFVYPVELHFSIKLPSDDEPDGWPTIRRLDFFTDDENNESLVMRIAELPGEPGPPAPDEPVSELFRRYRLMEFRDILAVLEGGVVPRLPRGRLP